MPVWDAWSCLGTSNRAHRALYSETPPAEPCPCCRAYTERHCSVLHYTAAPFDDLDPKSDVVFCAEMIPLDFRRRCLAIWRLCRYGGTESCLLFTRLPGMLTGTVAPPPSCNVFRVL